MLTRRERELLVYLETYTANHGMAPSLAEMAEQAGVVMSVVHERLSHLQEKGFIRRTANAERGIEVVSETERIIRAAVEAAAGADDTIAFGGVWIHGQDVIRVLTGALATKAAA